MKAKAKKRFSIRLAKALCLFMACSLMMGMTVTASYRAGEPDTGETVVKDVSADMRDDAEEQAADEPLDTDTDNPDLPETMPDDPAEEATEEPSPEDFDEEEEPADSTEEPLLDIYEYEVSVSGGGGWYNTPTVFQIQVQDLTGAGWAKVEISIQEEEELIDLTEVLYRQGIAIYTISKNCTIFVYVTDPGGGVHISVFTVECFDYDGPIVRAGIDNTVLHIEAVDSLSGVQGIIVNNKLYTTLENGILNLPISENTTDTVFEIRALDNLKNESQLSTIANPFYRDPSDAHGEHCPPDCDCRTRTTDPTPSPPASEPTPTATPRPAATPTPVATETPMPQRTEALDIGEEMFTIEAGEPFTTTGDAVTRDLLYDKYTNKQFIVLETRNGETFYLVIDYDKPLDEEGEHYETYFLNLVDEADLMALVDDDPMAATAPVCTCTDKCEIGHINTSCDVCRANMSECMGKRIITPSPEPEPDTKTEPKPEKPAKKNNAGRTIVLATLLLAAFGSGVFYWFKLRKSAPKSRELVDLDDYDYGEEEDSDEEYITEPDDTDASEADAIE